MTERSLPSAAQQHGSVDRNKASITVQHGSGRGGSGGGCRDHGDATQEGDGRSEVGDEGTVVSYSYVRLEHIQGGIQGQLSIALPRGRSRLFVAANTVFRG